ncbi:MAG TPA: hypothetical protein VFL93_16155 [Longimicrobiaceae bacterium]|nr:hypothetical protein [Longimicrobiaceae bacterium]
MQLSLSSAAAPEAALAELLAACARRGLAALELVEGHAHGVGSEPYPPLGEQVSRATRAAGVAVCALYAAAPGRHGLTAVARVAAELSVPIVVPVAALAGDRLPEALRLCSEAGAALLLAHGSDPARVGTLLEELASLPGGEGVGLAWEVRPETDDPDGMAGVPAAAGPRLRYVRLHGGGPESARQTGHGVGALMARLALARYRGPVVLTPSNPQYHYVWRAWLGRAGGWGCGSKQSDSSLVTLEHAPVAVGGDR